MVTTEWRPLDPAKVADPYLKEYPRRPKRVRAKFGMDEQFRFDVSGTVQEKAHGRWRDISSGQVWEAIEAAFPELARYLKWDGFDPAGALDYGLLEETWKAVVEGRENPEAFRSLARLGALGRWDGWIRPTTPWNDVREWLERRQPRVVEAFHRDMRMLAYFAGPEFGAPLEGPASWFPTLDR